MKKEDGIRIHAPFGPIFCEFKLTEKTVQGLNKFVDELEKDSKLRELDAGPSLAGQVSEEIKVPAKEVSKQGLGPELSKAIATYIENF